MRKLLLWVLFFLLPFLYSIYVCAQPGKEKDCNTTCFSSEVVSVEKISDTCTSYELNVSFSGDCAHALSHYTVAVPCGNIQGIWNSEGWAQEIGTDPTTGLTGFKIDNTASFGDGSLRHFTVKFTLCSTGENCAGQLNCWQPQVAYKASTCVNFETVAVNCRQLKASLEKADLSCFGAEDGSLSVVIEEGQEPYSFLWSDNSTEQSRTALAAGNYSVVVRDASGAELTLEGMLSQPEEIVISGTPDPASCHGVEDGAIDITISGGMGPYNIAWNNGAATEDIASLAAGQYTVTVTDQRNCPATSSFSIGTVSRIDITSTQVRPECNGTNGSIDITASGGTAPYAFVWSNGETIEDLQNIGTGLYTVNVSDAAGCSQTASYYLRDIVTLAIKGMPTPTTCTGDASGAIDLTVSGGEEPYSFAWSNGETTEDLSGLASGSYTVTVADAKGCTVSSTFTVTKSSFQVPRTVVQPSCHGDSDGSITLQEPIGGTGPFTYVWSNGETGTSLTDLSAGIYSVTVTDAAGCTRTLTCTITEPAEIFADAAVSNLQCNADGSFSVDMTVSGGTAPYSYEWSNGSTSEDIDGLQSGSYTVVITDAHGCSITKEVVVEGQPAPWACVINELTVMPVCGSQNNTLSASVTDADSYSWSVTSTDGNWSIAGNDSPSIVFTAGGENSSATFTLTIVKDGCTKTCTYGVTACTPQDNGGGTDPGGEDPGGEDPGGEEPGGDGPGDGEGGDESCEECFNTIAMIIEETGACRTYEMVVSTDGLCRHELSHWTLAIPCGTVSNYSNSEGWKMEYGKDPTTGLYGLKVDGINDFGKDVESFTVRFTICESSECELSYWDPTVAYKAGLCVGIEMIETEQVSSANEPVSVYPNPFDEVIRFEWSASQQSVDLEILDQYGNSISRYTTPTGKSEGSYITLESSGLPRGMYYYRLVVDGKTFGGKISKR